MRARTIGMPVVLAASLLRLAAPAAAGEDVLFWPARIDLLSAVPGPSGILPGDFDEDGRMDLLVLSDAGDSVALYRGAPPDGFVFTSTFEAGFQQIAGVLEDFDRDGHLDLLASQGSNAAFIRGNGDATFSADTTVFVGGAPRHVMLDDFDDDGHPDLVATRPDADAVSMLTADGSGGYRVAPWMALPGTPTGLAAGDYDEDGNLDLAISFRWSGAGTGSDLLAAGDYDGNGAIDLAVLSGTGYRSGSKGLAVLLNASGATGIDPPGPGGPGAPRAFALMQNYPNPFNPSTTIRYEIPGGVGAGVPDRPGAPVPEPEGTVPVSLVVFDLRGRLVRTLVDGERAPGRYDAHWDGRDDRGARVGSGVYLYRLACGGAASRAGGSHMANHAPFVETRKMLIVR